ncbi:MAG: GNAT family N-acetyltransferase [Clostridia bacterium]|nr:GNAT family N-acetyltransferase [Clostridia bacterium]
MIIVRETEMADLPCVKALWADGDVMKFVGFPDGLKQTDEQMEKWVERISASRPQRNHYSVFEDGRYCGESFYSIDADTLSASVDIKLFAFARGRGIATKALSHAIRQAFENGAEKVWVDPDPDNIKAIALYERLGFVRKPMPDYLAEDGSTSIYMELCEK